MNVSGEYIVSYELHREDGSVKQRGSLSMSVSESTAHGVLKSIREEIGCDNHSITGIYKL